MSIAAGAYRLVPNEPLFGIYAVPEDWPVLRQNLVLLWTFLSLSCSFILSSAVGAYRLVPNEADMTLIGPIINNIIETCLKRVRHGVCE